MPPAPPDDPQTLVSTAWLAAHLTDSDLRILDASWYLPDMGRDARAEHAAARIPGARFFDIDDISDSQSDLPHMAPPPERFISRVRDLDIGDGQQVVVYDGLGLFSAARAWWLFRLMGKRDVAVLDGGLPRWRAEGRPLEAAERPVPGRSRHLTVHRQPALVQDVTQVAATSKLGDRTILDARAPDRFAGIAPEPRPGLRAGHIPGARNLFYKDVLRPDGRMKDVDALRATFGAAGADLGRPVTTTCGSGVTAAILNLALERIGHRDHALYDGSWSEWGQFPDLPIATGEA